MGTIEVNDCEIRTLQCFWAKLLQHIQHWHVFIYSQSALKAALTWKSWSFCISASLGYRIGNLGKLPLMTVNTDKPIRQSGLGQSGPLDHWWQILLMSVKIAVYAGWMEIFPFQFLRNSLLPQGLPAAWFSTGDADRECLRTWNHSH